MDEYFFEAGRFVIKYDKASIGMLQRVFKIGFNRAARIMDELCETGVVGEEEGMKPRKILMTIEQFEQMIRNPELLKKIDEKPKREIQKTDDNKADANDLRNTCKIMFAIILETYRSFGVRVQFVNFKFEQESAVFGIIPAVGVRVKTVMSYEKDISLRLGTDVKMKLLSGYIGIFMPILQFKNRMKAMLEDKRFAEYYKKV